ncbi:MAG TPA: nuclear transport factor 2 family protein [Acidobacteria bacterium]|nr:nuclear transport factor 2 family protein [Acidobacteriota bacterium]
MESKHPRADAFLELLSRTQAAYERRDREAYLAGFGEDYSSYALPTGAFEDKAGLAAKIERDIGRFELLSMEFRVEREWYAGETGFALLRYRTRLRGRHSPRVLIDERRNIIVGRHDDQRWRIINKIVLEVETRVEAEAAPDI